MASEKAKENKALSAICSSCGKTFSVEIMVGLAGSENGRPKLFPVCLPCANQGWRPSGFKGVYTPRSG